MSNSKKAMPTVCHLVNTARTLATLGVKYLGRESPAALQLVQQAGSAGKPASFAMLATKIAERAKSEQSNGTNNPASV